MSRHLVDARRSTCDATTLTALLALALFAATASVATQEPAPRAPTALFVDVTSASGVDFRHRHFGTGEKYMPENMAPGVLVEDLDGDGRYDLYFVQGAPLGPEKPDASGREPEQAPGNRFYHQREDGTFVDRTERSGLGDPGYGMGAVAGDVDGDGDLDVYVTNFGRDALYRNLGDGRFEDVTQSSGLGSALWSTGATFFDADSDGDLDLYVASYVDFSFDDHRFCGNAQRDLRSYCHPDVYGAIPDVFYRNQGDGTFREETLYAGFSPRGDETDSRSKGLGAFAADLTGDHRADVAVANDSTMNFLFVFEPTGRFREGAMLGGLGYNADGRPEASMGIAHGDVDGDGHIDLFMTHLDNETNTLYRNSGAGLFVDATRGSGLDTASLPWVGFGATFFDADLDGDLDLFVGNGHIIDNIADFDAERRHRQPAQLFLGDGNGSFVERPELLPDGLDLVARGVAAADLDDDGDDDLVIAQNDGPALLLENRTEGRSVTVELVPSQGRSAIGSRVTLSMRGGRAQTALVVSASSYLSQEPAELVFGLGSATLGKLEVVWPDASRSEHKGLEPGHRVTVRQGVPKVVARPYRN